MKQNLTTHIVAVFVACSLLTLNSCKEDTILNANILPFNDTANTFIVPDTLTVLSKTVLDDSLVTSLSIAGIPVFHTIGAIATDPYSGKTNAGIYFQVVPPTLGFSFPKPPDSAVLILPYAGFTWGDTTAVGNVPQTFNVYEVTDSLSRDSTYYSFTYKNINAAKSIGSAEVIYSSLRDSVSVAGVKQAPHLRIRLDTAFISKIKTEAASGDALKSYAGFLRFLKGLYVGTSDSNSANSLYYFSLEGNGDYSRANVLFYYTDKTSSNQDTVKTASFYYTSAYGAHFNRIRRDYSGTPTGALMASTAKSDSLFVIQNQPGAALDLKFPFIKLLPKQPINKAELVITQVSFAGDEADKYTPPQRLYPTGIDASGARYTLLDRFPTTSTGPLIFMDGSRRSITIGAMTVSQYVINIPREVQKAIVEQRDTLHLHIIGAVTYPGAYRLVGAGSNKSETTLRVKLNLVYSKL